MHTFKVEGLNEQDAPTPYFYGSLPAKPELGHIIVFEDTGLRYAVYRITGEGLTGGNPDDDQRELAFADLSGKSVPTICVQQITATEIKASGRSFDQEELKVYSQRNKKKRFSA
jgi:hypothetical protein